MLSFAAPWWLLGLIPLPWLGWRWWRVHEVASARLVLRHPLIEKLLDRLEGQPLRSGTQRWTALLKTASVAALILALAEPQWLGAWAKPPPPARSVMLLVDASPSMMAQDFPTADGNDISRMAAMRQALNRFVRARTQDRFSLIVVTDSAATLLPMTADHRALHFWIDQLVPGINGSATALGDGLALAIRAMGPVNAAGQAAPLLVVWTDGFNTGGIMTPAESLALARERGIHVYTVNLAPEGAAPESGEPTLAEIANLSGGAPIAAGNLDKLNAVTEQIAKREAGPATQPTHRIHYPLYLWPVLLAALLMLVVMVLARREATA